MPIENQLLEQIKDALSSALPPNLTSTSAGADLYEGYLWSLVIRAARREGGVVTFENFDGSAPTVFSFRTSPGHIYSNSVNYSHAIISFPHVASCPELEVHVGVYVSGRSQVEHECDVAVLDREEARVCRRERVNPRCSKLLIGIEAKYYWKSSLGINLGRSFLGLLHDIINSDRFFVSTRDSSSVRKLFSKHNKMYELEVSPLRPDLEERLIGNFEQVFRDYYSGFA